MCDKNTTDNEDDFVAFTNIPVEYINKNIKFIDNIEDLVSEIHEKRNLYVFDDSDAQYGVPNSTLEHVEIDNWDDEPVQDIRNVIGKYKDEFIYQITGNMGAGKTNCGWVIAEHLCQKIDGTILTPDESAADVSYVRYVDSFDSVRRIIKNNPDEEYVFYKPDHQSIRPNGYKNELLNEYLDFAREEGIFSIIDGHTNYDTIHTYVKKEGRKREAMLCDDIESEEGTTVSIPLANTEYDSWEAIEFEY